MVSCGASGGLSVSPHTLTFLLHTSSRHVSVTSNRAAAGSPFFHRGAVVIRTVPECFHSSGETTDLWRKDGMLVHSLEPSWERGLVALRRYAAIKGSARVVPNARAHGVDVGAWSEAQRAKYWAGKLHPFRAQALEALPGWDWSGSHERRWHRRLDALARFARVHGTARVPAHVTVGHLRVGEWAASQRVAYAAGTLPDRNAILLEALPGWTWTADDECRSEMIEDLPRPPWRTRASASSPG